MKAIKTFPTEDKKMEDDSLWPCATMHDALGEIFDWVYHICKTKPPLCIATDLEWWVFVRFARVDDGFHFYVSRAYTKEDAGGILTALARSLIPLKRVQGKQSDKHAEDPDDQHRKRDREPPHKEDDEHEDGNQPSKKA